ncbi:Peroxin 13, N-terminal region-domain-containing protein [Naematelia encephala]|uniref:Peroxisomal membrane protein PEX13 n=1 Tax=Naematelia encephala TaxID=71784 RepID=A0A1Y2BFV9_9TREE|nr:Peroxin 13, N-terminal region-domain-containing protein [Naematelia encephala]
MAALPPRPKPWETNGANGQPSSSVPETKSSVFDNAVASSSSTSAPRVPERPAGLNDGTIATTSGYGGLQSSAYQPQPRYGGMSYGMSPYGGMGGGVGGYGSYGSMNRFGGGYGGGYGGYGMGGYGVGGMGAPGEFPNLTSSLQQSTAPAFAVIESLVTAFTSLAQLVESTYMATHSSFFAMVGVADQLGSLKTYLGQVLGVFSILRLGRRLLNWLRGRKVRTDGWANEWSTAAGGDISQRPSSKPLVLFLLSAVGLPWLMSRLVKLLIATTQQQQIADGTGNVDPSKLVFARAHWEFKPSEEWELPLGRDEIVAVLERRDGATDGTERGWWRGRTRDGRIGWFPGNHVEIIQRRQNPVESGRVEPLQ